MVRVVAAPNALTVVEVELNTLAVVCVELIVPPFTFTLPEKLERPDPRNEYVGFVVVFPKEIFSEELVVLTLM